MSIYISVVKMIKWFNAVNAGAELGLATPTNSCYFCLFFLDKECIYSVVASLYDHIKLEMFQTCVTCFHFSVRRETNERGNGPVLVVRALASTNVPARAVAFIISYQSKK